jgi:plasmid maintenance system antidote protein VapI
MMSISERLRNVMNSVQKNQKEFAELIGTTQATLSRQLNGAHKIDKQVALSIQAVFGIDSNWLLTGEGDMFLSDKKSNITNYGSHSILGNNVVGSHSININTGNINNTNFYLNTDEQQLIQEIRNIPKKKQKTFIEFLLEQLKGLKERF